MQTQLQGLAQDDLFLDNISTAAAADGIATAVRSSPIFSDGGLEAGWPPMAHAPIWLQQSLAPCEDAYGEAPWPQDAQEEDGALGIELPVPHPMHLHPQQLITVLA